MGERARARPPREETPEELLASTGVVLCPYCKGALVEGTLAGACEACNTLHHVSCFALHRGCSTRGCASTHAASLRVGSPPPADFQRFSCRVCRVKIEPDALVAECACGRVLDTNCFETIGSCGDARCQRPVRLLSHPEAVAGQARYAARVLGLLGGALLLLAGGLAAAARAQPGFTLGAFGGALLAGVGLFAAVFLKLAWGQRRIAASLARLPAPRPPGEGRDPSEKSG